MHRIFPVRWPAALCLALAACSGGTVPDPVPSSGALASSADAAVPSASAPAQPSMATLAVPPAFKAIGTEPFWSASVLGDTLIYSTPEFPEGARVATSRSNESGLVRLTGTIDGKPLELELRAGPCSDGMSDVVYPFAVTRKIGADIQRGCAA